MVVKTLIKQSFVSIKQTFNRFISILVIVLLGVGFFTGIRETSPNMKDSLDAYFKKENVYDISLMSTWGITDDEINDLKNKGYNVEGSYSFDTLIHIDDDYVAKVHSYDKNATMNKLIVIEGRLPHSNNECVIEKNKEYTIYLKDGEEISKTLALLGANKSVLKFEEIRVKREMNNKVNRLVNCETANMNKTMNASIEQIEIIRKLKQNGKFEKLEEPLKEIAELRLQNPSASLIELGKMLKTPIGKSGVNYRLKKVMEIGKKIDDNKK